MGYLTTYSLTWTKGDDESIGNEIVARGGEIYYAVNRDGSTSDSTKWYENETDMKSFSLKFPGVLFTLSGEGEESGDIWKKYFRDGKMQICRAAIVFPEFSARLLK